MIHLVKLCVGADSPEDLETWQRARAAERMATGKDPRPRHTTRMWPKRVDEALDGGSLYWVFKGAILARQAFAAFEPEDWGDGINRCRMVLKPDLIRTRAAPRRPFQGWRYLKPQDAPADLQPGETSGQDLPPDLRAALGDFGVL